MGKSIPPVSKDTFSKFSDFINEAIFRNESASIVGLSQREQIYRVSQFMKENDRPKIRKHHTFKIIDLKNYLLEDPEDIKLITAKAENKLVVYLLLAADSLLEEKKSLLPLFNNQTKEHTNLSLIFFFHHNITYPWILRKISSYHYLFQNIYYYPSYKENDQNQFIRFLENKFKFDIPNNIRKIILKECGGNFWLIKESVRYFAKTKDAKGLLNHEEMIFRLRVIFSELEEHEKEVIKKIVKSEIFFTDEEKTIADYFKKINFSLPLLNRYIAKQLAKENILSINKDKRIILNSVVVDYFFSKKERTALRYFLAKGARIIPREEIAAVVWGKNNSYTDWALDQFIRRLRKKFKKIGSREDLIKTVKNKGFFFNK